VTEPSHAVFLSYASQDAEAAQKICETLRAAGIEVWFDQSELRGGDAWDTSIRKQIKTCALFMPVISHTTHDRREGYFRLEWKLAVDRCHLMDADMAFLLPVVIDDTREDDERVPERFREVQWTRLPDGVAPAAFVERVRRLLSGEPAQPTETPSVASRVPAAPSMRRPVLALWGSKAVLLATITVLGLALGYLVLSRLVLSRRGAEVAPATVFNPPAHSIAVLPFVNLSGDKEQEYFSDGLTEELLNSLARINELQVAARTSSFSFQGTNTDIGTIAHKLGVASVLEGSVRRSGHTVRITAQLINAITGFHLWSQTYDRNLADVLTVQTEIADAVASALKVTLLQDVIAKIQAGATRNPAAFDAYLQASKAYLYYENEKDLQGAIAQYAQAIQQDPDYALAYADRSVAFTAFARNFAKGAAVRESLIKARADAQRAVALAPSSADGHRALGEFFVSSLEFKPATQEFERALALAPGDARTLLDYGMFAVEMGHFDAGVAAAHRAVELDPLSFSTHYKLGSALLLARRFREAIAALKDARALAPDDGFVSAWLAFAYIAVGDLPSARAACERSDSGNREFCLAIVYEKLGRHADAETSLGALRAESGDDTSLSCAMIYAQWGDIAHALDSIEAAKRNHDPYLVYVKQGFFLDPLRKEPRFQAIERELKLPD
jgi:TolB-like protein/Flp pilus assembly protein TadD